MKLPLLQRAKEALEELSTDKIMAVYDDPFVFEDVPSGKTITDPSRLRAYFQALFALPNIAFSDIRIYEADTFAVLEWIWTGTKRSSRQAYRVKGASIIELRNGRIARETIYYDPRVPLS